MQGINRTENIRMSHAETDCAISAHEFPGNPARVPVGQGLEIRIDVGHEFLDHEVFPVAGHRGIDEPGTSEWGGHIGTYENELVDHSGRDGSIEESLGPVVAVLESGGEEVDHRIMLR